MILPLETQLSDRIHMAPQAGTPPASKRKRMMNALLPDWHDTAVAVLCNLPGNGVIEGGVIRLSAAN